MFPANLGIQMAEMNFQIHSSYATTDSTN
ncbi:DUF6783 domain-containing protein [Blautia sp. HCP3S3_G3]